MRIRLAFVLIVFGGMVPATFGDTVHLKNGHTLNGRIVRETETVVVLSVGGGQLELARSSIAKIERDGSSSPDEPAPAADTPPPGPVTWESPGPVEDLHERTPPTHPLRGTFSGSPFRIDEVVMAPTGPRAEWRGLRFSGVTDGVRAWAFFEVGRATEVVNGGTIRRTGVTVSMQDHILWLEEPGEGRLALVLEPPRGGRIRGRLLFCGPGVYLAGEFEAVVRTETISGGQSDWGERVGPSEAHRESRRGGAMALVDLNHRTLGAATSNHGGNLGAEEWLVRLPSGHSGHLYHVRAKQGLTAVPGERIGIVSQLVDGGVPKVLLFTIDGRLVDTSRAGRLLVTSPSPDHHFFVLVTGTGDAKYRLQKKPVAAISDLPRHLIDVNRPSQGRFDESSPRPDGLATRLYAARARAGRVFVRVDTGEFTGDIWSRLLCPEGIELDEDTPLPADGVVLLLLTTRGQGPFTVELGQARPR